MNVHSQIIMSMGYLFFISSVLPNVRAVWKNRHNLRGFSKFGVTTTTIGLVFVQSSFIIDSTYLPFVVGFPNLGYWIMLTIFLWRSS